MAEMAMPAEIYYRSKLSLKVTVTTGHGYKVNYSDAKVENSSFVGPSRNGVFAFETQYGRHSGLGRETPHIH